MTQSLRRNAQRTPLRDPPQHADRSRDCSGLDWRDEAFPVDDWIARYRSHLGHNADAGARRARRLDERVDVFALGAVLFEILTLEPLVSGSKVHEMLTATLVGVDARARARAPARDVPPELELVCVRATAPLEQRTASARELRDAVERYLDGDRDVERRRELAAQKVAAAELTLSAESDGPRPDDVRTAALRDLGAAVALDPTAVRARELLAMMLLEGPEQMPEEARRTLEENRQLRRSSLRRTLFFVSLIFLTAPLSLLAMGVRNWSLFAMIAAAHALVPAAAFYSYKRNDDARSPQLLALAAMFALAAGSLVLGPLTQAPASILAVAILFLSLSAPRVRRGFRSPCSRWWVPFRCSSSG